MRHVTGLAVAAAIAVLAAGAVSAQKFPSHPITNGQITANVYLPDAKNGFYRTTRFDWSGAIGSLEYKGHNYYGQWFSKITDIYDFGYEGPSKDVISADFTAMVGPVEEYGAIGYNDAPPGGLVRQVRRQRGTVLKIGEIIDVDQCGDRLAMLADGDRTMTLPHLGDELAQVRLSRSQRIGGFRC